MKDETDIFWCKTYDDILQVITDWIDYYNNDRYQWDLAKLSPVQYYQYTKTGVYPLKIPLPKGGGKRPYYITKMGMTSSGIYVRHGNTSAPISADAIRKMIRETDGYSYESNLSF